MEHWLSLIEGKGTKAIAVAVYEQVQPGAADHKIIII
jgi:hypothetical protein